MSPIFSIEALSNSEKVDTNSILRLYNFTFLMNFMEIKTNIPNYRKKQIAGEISRSDSAIK